MIKELNRAKISVYAFLGSVVLLLQGLALAGVIFIIKKLVAVRKVK